MQTLFWSFLNISTKYHQNLSIPFRAIPLESWAVFLRHSVDCKVSGSLLRVLEKTRVFFPVAIETAGSWWSQQASELVQEIGRHHALHHREPQRNHLPISETVRDFQSGNAVSLLGTFPLPASKIIVRRCSHNLLIISKSVIDLGINRKRICNFLLVITSN